MPQDPYLSPISQEQLAMLTNAAGGGFPSAQNLSGLNVELKISNKGNNNKTTQTTPNQLSATPPPQEEDASQQLLSALGLLGGNDSGMQQAINQMRNLANQPQDQSQIKALQQYGQAVTSQPASLDLSSIASLVDAWTGSNFASTYKPPPAGAPEQAFKIQQALVEQRTKQAEQKRELLAKANGLQFEYEQYKDKMRLAALKLRQDDKKIAAMMSKGKDKKFNQQEWLAAGYASRMARADQHMESLYVDESALKDITGAWGSFTKNWAPEGWMSETQKLAAQAERDFVNAVLRRESGAAISKDEFKNAEKQYFPRWGDSPRVLAWKSENRKRVTATMQAASTGAYDTFEAQFPEFAVKGKTNIAQRALPPPPPVGTIETYQGKDYKYMGGDKWEEVM